MVILNVEKPCFPPLVWCDSCGSCRCERGLWVGRRHRSTTPLLFVQCFLDESVFDEVLQWVSGKDTKTCLVSIWIFYFEVHE